MTVRILIGDVRDRLKELPDESVHTVVTSPPYYGLRDYGVDGQIGLEPSPDAYIAELVTVFREVRRVMRQDATLWLNLGDSYAGSWGAQGRQGADGQMADRSVIHARQIAAAAKKQSRTGSVTHPGGIKAKDLMMIPARVALALQADGWWLRSDIIWHKPNPMPESVTDRPTSAHEHVFLLAKAERYYFNAEAVKEPSVTDDMRRPYGLEGAWQMDGRPSDQRHGGELRVSAKRERGRPNGAATFEKFGHNSSCGTPTDGLRNIRNVWTIATQPYSEAHFATFPPDLIEPCIKAGCPPLGTVLDPFGGAGTTGLVADRLQRSAILIELNPAYAAMAEKRLAGDAGIFASLEIA